MNGSARRPTASARPPTDSPAIQSTPEGWQPSDAATEALAALLLGLAERDTAPDLDRGGEDKH
jgi:hypothetical protein